MVGARGFSSSNSVADCGQCSPLIAILTNLCTEIEFADDPGDGRCQPIPELREMLLPLPESRAQIAKIQSERKQLAFRRAQQAPWYKGKLDHIDPDKLDDPEEWQKIPIIDKDALRQMSHGEFMERMCVAPKDQIAEYWRSGGTTGRPMFYPRTFEDVSYGLVSWARAFPCTGIGPGDLCHISFPLGIHPAGQIWARSAHQAGVGMSWVGAWMPWADSSAVALV